MSASPTPASPTLAAPGPAVISLAGLGYIKPDGAALFTGLELSFGPGRTGLVGRNGAGKTTLLQLISGDLLPSSGQIRRSGSLGVLRQRAGSAEAETIAGLFGAAPALALLGRAEAGTASLEELSDADWLLPARIGAALARTGLDLDPQVPLARLSGGQQSRAALAALVFQEPDFLLLDEPTNNLDQDGRQAVIGLIRSWKSGAIVVSHDRELLEEMDAITELTSLGATRYGGNYSAFRARKEAALDLAAQELAEAEKQQRGAARKAQEAAARKARKDSAGQRARSKGGQPKILMDAAKGRAEASGGAGVRLRAARAEAAQSALTAARGRIEQLLPVDMEIASSGLAPGRTVLRLEALSAGYDRASPLIRELSFSLVGPQRVLLRGPNGSGKSTLLGVLTGQLAPFAGLAEVLVPFALLDQQLGQLDPGLSLRENFLRLNPGARPHAAHAALARFGFRADAGMRAAGGLSGGERLRAGLACSLGAAPPPMLLILDEPTNHLDLEGITALEAALAGYDGAVLLVSHDAAFVESFRADQVLDLAAAPPG